MSPRSRAGAHGSVPERRDVYERLADELRQAIVSGQYKPGDKLPSTLELMERTGVANLTVRGAYRVLIEEGLVESVSKRGFYVRRPNVLTWRMAPGRDGRRAGAELLDAWVTDAEAAGLAHRQEISIAIDKATVPVLGVPVGERLGLPEGSRVLVRHAVRYTGSAGAGLPGSADSVADEYYPYELVRDTDLASPEPASATAVLGGLGRRVRGYHDEIRPRLATADERSLLGLAQVSVVLEVARTARTGDGQPVAVLHQVRRGDGATFSYEINYPGR